MCHLRNITMRDYQESLTTGQTDAGQSDPYVPLCFAGNTITVYSSMTICTQVLIFKLLGKIVLAQGVGDQHDL